MASALRNQPLPYLSYHESQETTIVLLHGAFASCHAFDSVVPRLSNYHLLIPDHTAATQDPRFCLEDLVDGIACLINAHAKGSCAHVFGLSFGGHLALRVAGHCGPDQVPSVFASGVNRLPVPLPHQSTLQALASSAVDWSLPYLVWGSETMGRIIRRLSDPRVGDSAAGTGSAQPATLQQARNLLAAISADRRFAPVPGTARVFLLAAVKTGWLMEEADSVRDARTVFAEVHPVPGQCSRCVAHSGLTHSWVGDYPDLFVEALTAIVEGRSAEGEFRDVSSGEFEE